MGGIDDWGCFNSNMEAVIERDWRGTLGRMIDGLPGGEIVFISDFTPNCGKVTL
jgi:hypothetical protein